MIVKRWRKTSRDGKLTLAAQWADKDLHAHTPSTAEVYMIHDGDDGMDPVWIGGLYRLKDVLDWIARQYRSGKTAEEIEQEMIWERLFL